MAARGHVSLETFEENSSASLLRLPSYDRLGRAAMGDVDKVLQFGRVSRKWY